MNIKHSDFPSFLFHSSTSLLISFLFSFPSLPFLFFSLFISGNFDCHVISVHPTASWRFQLHRALHYRASHRIFIAYLWFSEGEPRKIVNGRWGKRVNWIIKFFDSSRLFHCRHRTGSVERFRNNVDTKIQRFWLKYIYMYPCIVRLEIFIFHVNSEKIGRCNCPARNRLHRRKVHGLSKNSLDGLECGGWE